MSRSGKITFDWADDEYSFHLRVGEIAELQEKCDAGPAWIYNRLRDESWRLSDITETIRLALVGGGSTPIEAKNLVRRYVTSRPLAESIPVAMAVLAAILTGVPDEPPKKAEGETGKEETLNRTSPEERSDLPTSTDGAQP